MVWCWCGHSGCDEVVAMESAILRFGGWRKRGMKFSHEIIDGCGAARWWTWHCGWQTGYIFYDTLTDTSQYRRFKFASECALQCCTYLVLNGVDHRITYTRNNIGDENKLRPTFNALRSVTYTGAIAADVDYARIWYPTLWNIVHCICDASLKYNIHALSLSLSINSAMNAALENYTIN